MTGGRWLLLRSLIAIAALVLFTAPAAAQPVPPHADKILWCASAFYWLAGSAADSGETAESEMYDRWSNRLMEMGSTALVAEGFQPERIEELITSYDEAALVQIADDTTPYDVATCPALLGDWR
jgi:hypothetical protein